MAEAIVSIGDKGATVAFRGFWRLVEPAGSIRIIAPEEAVKKLTSVGYGRTLAKPSKVIVEQIDLEYFDSKAMMEHQDRLEPTYVFQGVLVEETGNETPFIQRIPATL